MSSWIGIVLLIPQSSGASDKRKMLAANASYEEALATIYTTIGCEGVKKKPDLSYKLSNATQKASPVGLSCDDDWEGLCDEVVNCQKKKKTTIAVSILVSEQVCLPRSILSFKVTYHVPQVYEVPSCPFERREDSYIGAQWKGQAGEKVGLD